MGTSRYGPPTGDAEVRAYASIVATTFAGEPAAFEDWVRSFGDDLRVLRGNGVVAGLTIYRMGQFFGGRSVPTWGIAGVAVPPHLRGEGIGMELMRAVLHENAESGPALSTLYPAVPALYRKLGWEFAGSRVLARMRLADLPQQGGDALVRPATPADEAAIRQLYNAQHAALNGCLDRADAIWQRLRRAPRETPVLEYVAERAGAVVGYLLYLQKRDAPARFAFDVVVRELVAADPGAALAMLNMLARHRSVAREVTIPTSPGDPWMAAILPNQEVPVESHLGWMLRIVRVKDALAQRGYADHVSARAAFELHDPELPQNNGAWSLNLAGGVMRVKRGGKGPRLEIGGLAALYAGCQMPSRLRAAGLLSGSDAGDAALAAMFAGPSPFMPDFF